MLQARQQALLSHKPGSVLTDITGVSAGLMVDALIDRERRA
jgi:hypothetical protein